MSVQAAQKTEADALLERLLTLTDAPSRKKLVAEHPRVDWNALVGRLAERVWQEVRVDTLRAERSADIAIEIAEILGDRVSLGKSLRAKANALYALDHHAAAIEFHDRAAALFEQIGNGAELARTLSGSIQPLLLLGRYDQALAAGERARKILRNKAMPDAWRGSKSISATSIIGRIDSPKRQKSTRPPITNCSDTPTPKAWPLR